MTVFPKYFPKASVIPSKYAATACITAHLLNRVWSRDHPKPRSWKTREDIIRDSPQRSQSCGYSNERCSNEGTSAEHIDKISPDRQQCPQSYLSYVKSYSSRSVLSTCRHGAMLERFTRTIAPPSHVEDARELAETPRTDPLSSLITKVTLPL